jgi:hypothetical protein
VGALHLIAYPHGTHVVVVASPVNSCPAFGSFLLLTQSSVVMPGFMPGIHVLKTLQVQRREWPGQARP